MAVACLIGIMFIVHYVKCECIHYLTIITELSYVFCMELPFQNTDFFYYIQTIPINEWVLGSTTY